MMVKPKGKVFLLEAEAVGRQATMDEILDLILNNEVVNL
jgi:hypothetical protein